MGFASQKFAADAQIVLATNSQIILLHKKWTIDLLDDQLLYLLPDLHVSPSPSREGWGEDTPLHFWRRKGWGNFRRRYADLASQKGQMGSQIINWWGDYADLFCFAKRGKGSQIINWWRDYADGFCFAKVGHKFTDYFASQKMNYSWSSRWSVTLSITRSPCVTLSIFGEGRGEGIFAADTQICFASQKGENGSQIINWWKDYADGFCFAKVCRRCADFFCHKFTD